MEGGSKTIGWLECVWNKRSSTSVNHIHIILCEPHGSQKQKYNRYTHTKRMESKYNTKDIRQLQGERAKEEMNKKEIQKQLDNN